MLGKKDELQFVCLYFYEILFIQSLDFSCSTVIIWFRVRLLNTSWTLHFDWKRSKSCILLSKSQVLYKNSEFLNALITHFFHTYRITKCYGSKQKIKIRSLFDQCMICYVSPEAIFEFQSWSLLLTLDLLNIFTIEPWWTLAQGTTKGQKLLSSHLEQNIDF